MVRYQVILQLVALLLAPALLADSGSPLPVKTTQEAEVRDALRMLEAGSERAISDWMEICRIPALPRDEGRRAEAFALLLSEAGLPARVLADGNVEARWAGSGTGEPAVLSAHLDALHAPSPGNPVRRTRQALMGPGVLDDGSGLAAILAAVRALKASGWTPRRELRIVATMGEEIGLVGSRSYLGSAGDIAAFVSVDGILGRIDHGATGIRWTRYTLSGPGGHTLLADQIPSPSFAAGRAITSLADLAQDDQATLNVSELKGGMAPNAIPQDVSFTVDLRSDDAGEFRRLTSRADEMVREAARSEGVRMKAEILQDLPAARLPGSETSPLVRGAASILRHVGVAPRASPRGSSDHNAALLRGIPAISVGATLGRNAHAPVEVAELEPFRQGCAQVLLLAVLLGEDLADAPLATGQ